MNTKFVLFFLVAVSLAQSFEARTIISPSSINDIIKSIEEVIQDIENALSELIVQLPEMLDTLKKKIEDIINSIDVDQIVETIQNQVAEIMKKFGVDTEMVQECVDKEEADVKQLIHESMEGLANCKEDAEDEIKKLNDAAEELKSKARKLIEDSAESVKQCIKEHGANLIEVSKCLKEHLEVIKTDAEQLIQEILHTLETAKNTVTQVPLELAKCVAGVEGEALFKQKDIIDEFTKCVEAHKQEQ